MAQIVTFRTLKPYADYDWMHPSWRDLVIEHLQASKADRERFLSRCGPQGVLLALSSAGGGKGTRETPLLIDAGDWMGLQTTILALLKSSENRAEVQMVLRAIQGAMVQRRDTKQPRLVPPSDPLHSMAMKSLETLRIKWDTANKVISAATLSEYCNVSVLLSPLPPIPDIRLTWEDRWASVAKQGGKGAAFLDAWTEAISEWLDLVEIVESNEPRLLQQMSFPELHLNAMRNYLDYVEREANRKLDSDEADDYTDKIVRMEELDPVVEQIGSVLSSLEDRAEVVRGAVGSAESDLRDTRNEKFPEPDGDYEGRSSASRPSGGFDVDELFADL